MEPTETEAELDDLKTWIAGSFKQFLLSDPTATTSTSSVMAADYVMKRIQAYVNQERKKAAIEELAAHPLNWALNRKDKTWEMMVRSRIAELEGGEQ
jgi:hypothetical protein